MAAPVRIVDESADGFILMDGTSHALLTRRGHIVKTRLAFFAMLVQPCFFFSLGALRGLFDIAVVVVVYIAIPKRIALRHLASIMIASSFEDF